MARTEIDGDQAEGIDNLQFGLNSAKPTTCKAGDMYVSTDKKWVFVCFVANEWTRVNAVDFTGAAEEDLFIYDGTVGFLVPRTAKAIKYGLNANRAVAPTAGDVYIATDTSTIYYCFVDGTWVSSFDVDTASAAYAESNGESSTTSATFQTKTTLTYTPPKVGNYDVRFSFLMTCSAANKIVAYRILVDGVTVYKAGQNYEPRYYSQGYWKLLAGNFVLALANTDQKTIEIQYASISGSSCYIKEAAIIIKKL